MDGAEVESEEVAGTRPWRVFQHAEEFVLHGKDNGEPLKMV